MLPTSGISPRGVIFNAYIKEALHSHKDYSQRMLTLSFCRKKVHHLSNEETKQQRKELFQAINGDASFPLKAWPKKMIFYNKLPGDTDTIKLLLFCLGKGCLPHLSLDFTGITDMGTGESGEASTTNRLSCKQLGQQTPCVVLL